MGFGLGSLNPVRIVQGKGAIGEALGPAAPILAGLALGPAGYGLTAMQAGLAVGGISALASGNLSKGLSAGLGAYGGASISAGLSGMGSSAIGDAAKAETLLGGGSQAMAADNAAFAVEKAGLVDKLGAGASYATQNPTAALKTLGEGSALKGAGILGAAAAPIMAGNMVKTATPAPQSSGLIRPYQFNREVITPTDMVQPSYQQGQSTRERNWFENTLTANQPFEAPGAEYKKMAVGGPVEAMSNANAVGANTGYPQADITGHAYATPWQTPVSQNVVQGTADTGVNRMNGQMLAEGGMAYAGGGLPSLGGYASGGNPRLLKGPGDGMSDNIPAVIGGKQPARLADGEFVVPADVVSHLGNGSTEAGAKQLYKMMDRIRAARTGKKKQAPEVNPKKALPA